MSNEKQSLGIKSSTVTAFLNDKLTPEQCKELQNIMNLNPKLEKKYSSIEVNLDPIQNWSSKIGLPILGFQSWNCKIGPKHVQKNSKTRPKKFNIQ